MPLTPRYTWEEDAASVALHITLPGAALKHVDIFISDLVVKVNAAPYVLLLDLFDCVDETTAVVKRNASTHVLHVTVNKSAPTLWHHLTWDAGKAQLKERRLASMERKQQSETLLAEKRKDRKYKEEKQTLRAQMAVDDSNRQILTDLKAAEKAREEQSMYDSFKELKVKELQQQQLHPERSNQVEHAALPQKPAHVPKPTEKKRVAFAATPEVDAIARTQADPQRAADILELSADGSFDIMPTAQPKVIWDDATDELTTSDEDIKDTDEEDEQSTDKAEEKVLFAKQDQQDADNSVVQVPPPRAPAQTEIHFTPRLFPTPSRESKAVEEEDWMLKNRKHLNKHKGLRGTAGAYDISESDPAWLKAKGDDFYRSRDNRSAVNAYSEAILAVDKDQTDLLTACLSNRAACHLQLAAFELCLNDCTKALSYLPDTPAAAGSTPSAARDDHARIIREFRLKLKLLVRRGTALCRLGKFTEAKADYGVALTMDKQNGALQHDYMQLLQLEKSHQAKERGDECFKQNQLDDAITRYDECLRLHPHSIACLSNRAACFLRRHELQKCVDDCSTALKLLQQRPAESNNEPTSGIAFFAVGPAPGTAKRREWVVKTLVRRGTAHAAMKQMNKAESDYGAAVELDPLNEALISDFAKIRQQLEDKPMDEPVAPRNDANETIHSAP